MKQIRFFSIVVIITLFHNYALGQNDSMVAVTELQRMNTMYGHRVEMKFIKEGEISSLPNQEIHLNLAELNKIITNPKKSIRFYLVRFVTAHEFAHQIQYFKYGNDEKYMNNDLISRTLIETQADILAGLIFLQLSPELMQYLKSDQEFVTEVLEELFTATHNIGIQENTLGTHPSKRDRMLAVRLGLTNGFGYMLDQWVKSDTIRAKQSGLTHTTFKKSMDDYFRFIDLNKNENFLEWSYRQAKKIANYDRKISNDLVLITPTKERILWHEESEYPYVNYKLKYKNIGKKSIDTEMEVYVAHVLREESNSPEGFVKVNVDHHKFTILPGEQKEIKGRLLWLKNITDSLGISELRDSHMPRIIYPGFSDDAIYSCGYSGDVSTKVFQEEIPTFNFSSSSGSSNSGESIRLQSFFLTLVNNFNNRDAIRGIGERNTQLDAISYVGTIQLDKDIRTEAHVDSLGVISSIDVIFPNYYPDGTKMQSEHTKLRDVLALQFQGDPILENRVGESTSTTFANSEFMVVLEAIKNDQSKQYFLRINFFKR